MTTATNTARNTREVVRRAGSNLLDALGCRKIMAMVNPPKTSSISFGRMNTEPAQAARINTQARKPP